MAKQNGNAQRRKQKGAKSICASLMSGEQKRIVLCFPSQCSIIAFPSQTGKAKTETLQIGGRAGGRYQNMSAWLLYNIEEGGTQNTRFSIVGMQVSISVFVNGYSGI